MENIRTALKVPHGYLRKIAKASGTNNQQVGATLGIYPDTNIGVSLLRKHKIKAAAIAVVQEEKKVLDAFIAAVEAVEIS